MGIKPARTDRPVVRTYLRHIQVIRQSQCFWYTRGPGTANLVAGDNFNRRWRLSISLRLFGYRCNLLVHQLFQAHFFVISQNVRVGLGGAGRDGWSDVLGVHSGPKNHDQTQKQARQFGGGAKRTLHFSDFHSEPFRNQSVVLKRR